MSKIEVIHHPNADQLASLGVTNWPVWAKEASRFPWQYDCEEVCYLLAGDVTVTPDGGEPVRFGKGDLVTFPAGMSCHWEIHQAVKKHYDFR